MNRWETREGDSSSLPELERLYPDAFPDEELLPLVRDLLQDTPGILSLVAVAGQRVIGHVIFTPCGVTGSGTPAALLGPLAVATNWQRCGVGSALVKAGLDRLRPSASTVVLVLGDPAYYGRFGFKADRSVEPPFPLPDEWLSAWQSVSIASTETLPTGKLRVPPAWDEPKLWGP